MPWPVLATATSPCPLAQDLGRDAKDQLMGEKDLQSRFEFLGSNDFRVSLN